MSYDNQQHPAPISFHEAENVVQRQTSPGNLQQGKPSTDVPSLDKGNLQQGKLSTAVHSLDKVHLDCVCPPAGNVVQRPTSPRNLQPEKPSTNVPSLGKVVKDMKDSGPVGGSVPDFPPSSTTPYLKDSSGPVGSSVPGFPPSSAAPSHPKKEANCIKKCLATLSPRCCYS
ncbi:hypothetical protein F2P56_013789 [Juglans regia]|uniref:Uncharacterized protein LOC109002444 isoform X1 n=2 Tax=Juglans regia TaxID=51240 RepID=A0A2I4FVR8_JUGRE|nr:uncharacterized protein LOC109002444 isoform X1 [Juglans regia]XP_035548497.1 uncharacterized protein LOC109002444 isoform X1 [Juglans regia]KAF5463633.1 hypothetical protein F2P56_013789 [Juglans regia]